METKQTAVEWLEEQLISSLGIELTKHQKRLFNDVFIKQAKEMEKEQIKNAYYVDRLTADVEVGLDPEFEFTEYYNEQYGKQ